MRPGTPPSLPGPPAGTAAVPAAFTQDVIAVLDDTSGLGRTDPLSVVMGLVENHRVRVVAEGRASSWVPGLEYTGIDEEYPTGWPPRGCRGPRRPR